MPKTIPYLLGIQDFYARPVVHPSKRIVLAAAPPELSDVVVTDEPTNHLDACPWRLELPEPPSRDFR